MVSTVTAERVCAEKEQTVLFIWFCVSFSIAYPHACQLLELLSISKSERSREVIRWLSAMNDPSVTVCFSRASLLRVLYTLQPVLGILSLYENEVSG